MYRLAVLLALVGCTHRTSIRNAGREVGETATMRYPDGGDRRATFLGYVSTGIVVSEDGQQYTVPYEALESIEFTSHAGGAWQGVKWGAAVGAIVGVVWGLGLSSQADEGEAFSNPAGAAFAGAALWTLGGIVFGLPIGAIKGRTTVYSTRIPD